MKGSGEVQLSPQNLANQSTLFQLQVDYAHHITCHYPGFSDLPMALYIEETTVFIHTMYQIERVYFVNLNISE